MSLRIEFWNLRQAYRWLCEGNAKAGRLAIKDLRRFCRADKSCIVVGKDGRVDTHATAVAEGRREVYLRIIQMLELTDEQILALERTDEEENG